MRASLMVSALMFAHAPHVRDSDCTIGADGCCITCGVSHENDPCPDCGGRGFHSQGDGGDEPCEWTGEKQKPAKTAVERATEALARNLGYESATAPGFLSGYSGGGQEVERYELNAEDRSLLREIEVQRAIGTHDQTTWGQP